jgi:predicted metal-dependent phosphoesterase TrpH
MVATSFTNRQAASDTVSLKKVWQSIDFDSCPRSYNFHLHTVCSDGRLTPSELVRQAVEIGLKGFTITDHHSVGGYHQAQLHLQQLRQQNINSTPHLWTGVEITSQLKDIDVHILGYAFDWQHPALELYLQGSSPKGVAAKAQNVIESIHQAGGLAVLAHPARYRRPAAKLIPLAAELGIDGVEAYYAYGNPEPWQPSFLQTQEVLELAAKYQLYHTCGTDTHGLSLLKRM